LSNINTPLQDSIQYKSNIISLICQSPKVVGLLVDDPNVDVDSDEVYEKVKNCIFDYDYVSKTVERSDAFIMVDADMISPSSGSINNWEIYIQVVCHKNYMALDPKVFKGVKGNRRDNLMCEVDNLINGSRIAGIGKLTLFRAITSQVPDSFTSKLLTYGVPEFRRERLR
jgi:hypothetical protein